MEAEAGVKAVSPVVETPETPDTTKKGVMRVRLLGQGMVWCTIRALDSKSPAMGIQAVSRGEAIKEAHKQMPGYTFDIQNIQ